MKTYYERLGVPRQASPAEIERAYRDRLADHLRRGGAHEARVQRQLRALREGFLLLSSPAHRAEYDRQLAVRVQRRARRLRLGGALLCVLALVGGFAMMGGAWYRQATDEGAKHTINPAPRPVIASNEKPAI